MKYLKPIILSIVLFAGQLNSYSQTNSNFKREILILLNTTYSVANDYTKSQEQSESIKKLGAKYSTELLKLTEENKAQIKTLLGTDDFDRYIKTINQFDQVFKMEEITSEQKMSAGLWFQITRTYIYEFSRKIIK
jgi:hypothetical protein